MCKNQPIALNSKKQKYGGDIIRAMMTVTMLLAIQNASDSITPHSAVYDAKYTLSLTSQLYTFAYYNPVYHFRVILYVQMYTLVLSSCQYSGLWLGDRLVCCALEVTYVYRYLHKCAPTHTMSIL